MAWFDRYDFSPAPCMPCCTVPVTCYLTLPPPVGATPYSDINTATSAIASQTNNCAGFFDAANFIAFSCFSSATAITTNAAGDTSTTGVPFFFWNGLYAASGDVLSIAYSLSGGFAGALSANIFDATGNLVESFSSSTNGNPFVSSALPNTGAYEIQIGASALLMPGENLYANSVITTSGTMIPCGIRAAYGNVPDYVVCA